MERARGFSLLELAMTLVVVGLLLSAGLGALGPAADRADAQAAESFQQAVRQALINFAATHHRLPCPDTDMDGYENDCSGNGVRGGGVPYYTLNMTPGTSMANTDSGAENMLYGVYRQAAIDADLTLAAERTGDAPGAGSYRDIDDFRQALINASQHHAGNGVSATEVHVTGDGISSGAEDCGANRVANMAFVLISSGARDADSDSNAFDGLNRFWQRSGNPVLCAASPGRPRDVGYDDTVVALSFDALLGELG